MDGFGVVFLIVAALCLGGILCAAMVILVNVRRRRERLQMRRHVQTMEWKADRRLHPHG